MPEMAGEGLSKKELRRIDQELPAPNRAATNRRTYLFKNKRMILVNSSYTFALIVVSFANNFL